MLDWHARVAVSCGLRSPDGNEMWGKFVYREIAAPERLVFVSSFSDADGNTVRAPFSETWPLEILNTLSLVEHEGMIFCDLVPEAVTPRLSPTGSRGQA